MSALRELKIVGDRPVGWNSDPSGRKPAAIPPAAGRLSRRSMQSRVAEAGERGGLGRLDPPVKVTPHVLRHTYTYMLRQAGVSTEVRAELSSHSIERAMKHGRPKAREK
ncbi:MAG TPA: hypothetical protein VMT91_09870, partial [Anaerolineales bacterium]|nr:hypothetical protein [Anaerolineales bacterium]